MYPSKNRADLKEDTEKASSNLWLTAFEVQCYITSNLSYPELEFDVQHAYIKVICESSKNRADVKKILRSPVPMLEWQPPRKKVIHQMFHYDKSFKLICHMPIFQVIYKYSKNQVDSKEDIEKTSPNAGMAASMIKSYQLKHSACKELPFDILHAYLESNRRVFQESGLSKKKTL